MNDEGLDAYLRDVIRRLRTDGFSEWTETTPGLGDALVFHRRKGQLSKMSLVDTFCAIKAEEHVLPADFTAFSQALYSLAIANKSWAPRGFGGMVVSHAAVVTSQASSEAITTAQTYAPKHMAATEFPALVELGKHEIHYLARTQIWGAAYARGFRNSVENYFGPR